MTFLYPEMLWWGIAAVPLYLYLSGGRFRLRPLFFTGSLVLALAALARPGTEKEPEKTAVLGPETVLALDVSRSMHGEDIPPTRLEAAKERMARLTGLVENGRFAVVAFTTNALILSPMTDDRELLLYLSEGLNPENVITRGTAIGPVIEEAAKLSERPGLNLVLFTDGGDDRDFTREIRAASEKGIAVHVVGMASTGGSTLKNETTGKVLEDEAGHVVVSVLNRRIRELAEATGGVYVPYGTGDVEEVAAAIDAGVKRERKVRTGGREEEFWPFALGAFLLFTAAVSSRPRKFWPMLALAFLWHQPEATAGFLDVWYLKKAREAYAQKDFREAATWYGKLAATDGSPQALYNQGVSYYLAGEYGKAVEAFGAVRSADRELKRKVYYNMANSYAKAGDFQAADEHYLKSLLLGYDPDADANRQAVRAFKKVRDEEEEASLRKKKKSSAGEEEGGGAKTALQAAESGKGGGKKTDAGKKSAGGSGEKRPLGYNHYRLINKGGSDETRPW